MMLRTALGPRPSFVIEARVTRSADRSTLSKCSLTTADVTVGAEAKCSVPVRGAHRVRFTKHAMVAWGARLVLCAAHVVDARCS
jgi:hypothetical protein